MQKTAYELRISDWSSDVCSSDLHRCLVGRHLRVGQLLALQRIGLAGATLVHQHHAALLEHVLERRRHCGIAGGRRLARAAGEQEYRIRLQVAVLVGRDPRSEEHTSELQSLMRISYAVFCLKKKKLN